MWASVLKYLGVELIKQLTKALIKWLGEMNEERKTKKVKKIKKQIETAKANNDYKTANRLINKLK